VGRRHCGTAWPQGRPDCCRRCCRASGVISAFSVIWRTHGPLCPCSSKKSSCAWARGLAPRRGPSRAPCLARRLRSGASAIGQTRHPATPSEGIRPTWPRRALRALGQTGVKKQLRAGMARWLGSGHCPERSAWLGRYARVLLTPAICADVPPPARASAQTGRGELQKASNRTAGRQ
jgi:hypothetical protein